MKTFKPTFALLALSFMLVTSMKCKKDNPAKEDLPLITQEGKRTFGCVVNGLILIPFSASSTPALSAERTSNVYSIVINSFKSNPGKQYLYLSFKKTTQNKMILNCITYYHEKYNGGVDFEICQPTNYELNVSRLDDVNLIFSGTFSVDIPATSNSPAFKITDGRFDVKFPY